MLRRKLLFRIGLLICAFVAGAVVALALLQDALSKIDRTNRDAAILIDGIQSVGAALIGLDSESTSPTRDEKAIAAFRGKLDDALRSIGAHDAVREPGAPAAAFNRLKENVRRFVELNAESATARSPEAATAAISARAAVQTMDEALRAFVAVEQADLGRYFRALVLGLTVSALIMVNVAVIVLLRTAQVVLRPVSALVEGSRELAAENFGHRVTVDQKDEFGELAVAYNRLAAQLQSNEERKAETLRQLAVTLNHDLNNAMAVIEMQLGLLDRRAGGDPVLTNHLTGIRASLARMSGTVSSLKNIRRIVLTEYAPGQKMLDLPASVEPQIETRPVLRETNR